MKPCRSPYCECEAGKCTHDARHDPQPSTIPADASPDYSRGWKDGVKHGAWLNTSEV
jgi:hypothetical protein